MKRAIVLALTMLCALALVAVPAQAAGGKAKQAQRPGRAGVCVVIVKQSQSRTAQRRGGARRSPRCRGPRGFRGPRGRAGPRGANGKDGAKGTNGTNGSNGRDGATGPAGPKGDKGDKGDPGTPAAGGTRYAIVRAAETTSSTSFVALTPPGPSVTVTVPESGTIQVAASALVDDGDGLVSLYEDGVQMPGQNDVCADDAVGDPLAGVLFDAILSMVPYPGPVRFGTGGGLVFGGGCSTNGAPSAVTFQTTPGRHTYELRYALSNCGCSPEVTFSDRKLWVTPLA